MNRDQSPTATQIPVSTVDRARMLHTGIFADALDPTEERTVKWMIVISVIFTQFVSKEPVDAGLDSKVMASNAKN